VTFISADTGFAVYSPCRVNEDPMCRQFAGVTTDRGRTWRSLKLPDMPGNYGFDIFATSASTFVVSGRTMHSNEKSSQVWITRDGGAAYTSPPDGKVPDEFKAAGYAMYSAYDIECPGVQVRDAQGIPLQPEQFQPDPAGCTTKMTKFGGGPLDPQPSDLGLSPMVASGGDGRIWLTTGDAPGPRRLRMSDDGGRSWKEMPELPDNAYVSLSPDGTEIYYERHPGQISNLVVDNTGEIARLAEGKWDRIYGPVKEIFDAIPVGDGSLFVSAYTFGYEGQKHFFLKDGVRTIPPLVPDDAFARAPLKDGTLVLEAHYRGIYVGAGRGINREWTFITY
jgi:hypothetical protein